MATTTSRPTVYEKGDEGVTCRLPPPKHERGFKAFVYNPKTKAVLGRTASSWGKIGLFYVVFYIFLAFYFFVMMSVFYKTLDPDTPKYTGAESLLLNPGLAFLPRTFHDDLRPTIKYDPRNNRSSSFYVKSINDFYKAYMTRPSNARDCLPGEGYLKPDDPPCFFDLAATNTSCTPQNDWGYNTNSPCIILKLNKMFHWRPQPPQNFEDLPEGLQRHINDSSEDPEATLKQHVWIWCESESAELEQKYPGIPLSFFPYHKQEGYLAPLVPVRILNLNARQRTEVDCRVWANNVQHKVGTRMTGEAKVIFQLEGEPSK